MNTLFFCIAITFPLITSRVVIFEKECTDGACVLKHLCPNRTYYNPKNETHIYDISIYENGNHCDDYRFVCCPSAPNAGTDNPAISSEELINSSPSSSNYGLSNESDLVYNLHNNDTVLQYAEFPWVVYIFTRTGTKNFVCGGTLIHPRFVVTTAHNVDGKKDLVVRFGQWDISTTKEPYPQQEINVKEIIKHPDFVLDPIQNDIALLLLADNVRYEALIRPISLPQVEDNFVGQRCISNRWGTVQGAFPVIDRANCTEMLRYAGLGPFYNLRDGFMCAGGKGHVDPGKGDGGSPLACQTEGGSYVLAGIVLWGIGYSDPNILEVYVAVNLYLNWTNENLANDEQVKQL